ncbi:hypothetical protein BDF20DRAFT_891925 [Mycotypha africana]|uniref:uncharacterized protein n=1 Tax=Mycotypha africana TaxID=64632 RepID=UPI0022FFD6AF|nr:uncharacterized protein BDF20DRAFT_902366 [Mycotypha africana]XP_052932099.1 uncharacterized protein BDF20DRAFT_891925 [Mycotypha africana]KAI8967058.1 hypothetical protein BDF20DRAFT_902366 [Mycotypha africana]KAI8968875.1 hypothetical protein BDF20DRAFT_891925 [Mycotypha africana]
MDNIIFEDGLGGKFDKNGAAVCVVNMDVDTDNYPLGAVTDFDMFNDFKPPERSEKKEIKKESNHNSDKKLIENEEMPKTTYRKYKKEYMETFLFTY